MAEGRSRLAGLEPDVKAGAEWCLAVADYYGVPVTVVSGKRSSQEQARLYRNYRECVARGEFGRSSRCKYPANPPGESAHEFGLAFDSVVAPELMDWWVRVRRAAGFHVIEGDLPHAEVPNWRAYV
jgi:hypothetical protein